MNSRHAYAGKSRTKQVVCTVSAAALMLGVSEAATVGLHFTENYCGSAAYSGYPVTLTAFGVATNAWQNLMPMQTGYGSCDALPIGGSYEYTLSELIDTTAWTNGLNPLPNGSLEVTWSANGANFSGFAGYGGAPPSYGYFGDPPNPIPTGEWQIYSTFLRDGVNFGAGHVNYGDNVQPPYNIDITGLKSVFTNSPFVIELIASADSMDTLTNAFIIDVAGATTNSVMYPSTPLPTNVGDTSWWRGHGGGLSTVSGALNADHIEITSNHPQHGGTGAPPTGYNRSGTIAGFIVTDKPVVTMSAQPVLAGPHDAVLLNPYAIGVPPLAYQWLLNGVIVPGATNLSLVITNLTENLAGNYELVVTNDYGSTTSKVTTVTEDKLSLAAGNNFVADTNPTNTPRVGIDYGATWLASASDGTTTRDGVMQFVAVDNNEIVVAGTTNFDNASDGTITFWMRSAGTDTNAPGNQGAALFGQANSTSGNDFVIAQQDGGNLFFNAPNGGSAVCQFPSSGNVSDNKWHFIALTFDQTGGGVASLYIDGVLDNQSGNAEAWALPSKPIVIGSSTDSYWRAYNGMLNDLRFYSRQLTPTEIATVFSTGSLIDPSNLQMDLSFSSPPGFGFSLSWLLNSAVLQSAPALEGPYTDVIAAPSPFNVSSKNGLKFYRYRFVNQNWISNPYLM